MAVPSIDLEYFCREVEENRSAWTLRQAEGVLTFFNDDGVQVMPLWSTRERVLNFVAKQKDFEEFIPLEIPLELLNHVWLPDLKEKDINVGVNHSGKTNIGCEVSAEEIISRLGPNFPNLT